MRKLPERIKNRLKKEAIAWDSYVSTEKPQDVEQLLKESELFVAKRPPRRPVSLRVDQFDIAMAKRIARQKGIPFTQLMSMWLHERIEKEKKEAGR